MTTSLATPRDWWEMLNAEFGFTLDAAADDEHFMCTPYYTLDNDALIQPWDGVVWCSPPWHDQRLIAWIQKGYMESKRWNSTVVMLLPIQVYRSWWHDLAMQAKEIRFINGCLQLTVFDGDDPYLAVEPHCLVIFKPHSGQTKVSSYPSRASGEEEDGLATEMFMTHPPKALVD